MKKQAIHSKSLELLQKYVLTNKEELSALIAKHENSVAGPTYAEYLTSLDDNIFDIECDADSLMIYSTLEWDTVLTSPISDISCKESSVFIPPDLKQNLNKNKKDSDILSESFFLV